MIDNDERKASEATDPAVRLARLRWRARRGMRELDALLLDFVDRGLSHVDGELRAGFERLLEMPDQELIGWLTGTTAPTDGELLRVVEAVRDHARR